MSITTRDLPDPGHGNGHAAYAARQMVCMGTSLHVQSQRLNVPSNHHLAEFHDNSREITDRIDNTPARAALHSILRALYLLD